MNKKLSIAIVVLIFVAGVGIMSYPLFSSIINNMAYKDEIVAYDTTVKNLTSDKYKKLYKSAKKYNDSLNNNVVITDPFDPEQYKLIGGKYESSMNVDGKGLIGSVEIPIIDVNLPIYHSTKDEVLEKGAGHLPNTSLPIGGKGTHSVIAAHTGFPGQTFFDYLVDMKKGDYFLIHVLDKTLQYKVDQIKVVKPEDISELRITQGKDYVTLLTCTPYGINSHRLLVRGVRVPYNEKTVYNQDVSGNEAQYFFFMGYKIPYWVAGAVIAGFITLVIIIVIFAVRRNKKTKPAHGTSKKEIVDNDKT